MRDLSRALREAWEWAEPRADRWYLHPEAETPRPVRALIPVFRPVRWLAFRLRLAWLLLTTPDNTAMSAPWERRDLRWKALLLLALPQHRHRDYSDVADYDDVLIFDAAKYSGGWHAWILAAPTGWRPGLIYISEDGDSTW